MTEVPSEIAYLLVGLQDPSVTEKGNRKPLHVISFVAFHPQKAKYIIIAKFTLTSDSNKKNS